MFAASSAVAGPVTPTSYDTPNGESGLFSYFDDSYSGSGNKGIGDAPLSGGLGDLTDGVIATGHWFQTPGAYVGWSSVVPDIDFHFGGAKAFSGVTLYFDDANGYGSVDRPTSIQFDTGHGFQTLAPTITTAGPLARYDFDLAGALASDIIVRLNHPIGETFVMLTEASFAAEAVPEPATWMVLAIGTGMVGMVRRRRRLGSSRVA